MLAELCADNQQLTRALRAIHEICARHNDVATRSLIEVWIYEAEPQLVPERNLEGRVDPSRP